MNYKESADISVGCGPLLHRNRPNAVPLRQHIFEHVRAIGRTARAEIARSLEISAGSATTQTADLITAGLLREVDDPVREHGRGRPRVSLEVVSEAGYVVGIKLSADRHSAVLSDFAGNVVATASLTTAENRRSPAQLRLEITDLMEKLITKGGMAQDAIKAVGIGVPGIVDQNSGIIRWCSLLNDTNVDLHTEFAKHSGARLLLDNDTNMLTLSELWFGAGRDKTDFAVVSIEAGVGMGLVVNNGLYRGTHGLGLELGHTKVQLDGALCRCGQRGCLEAYLGDYALTREARTALDGAGLETRSPKDLLDVLFEQAQAGHTAAQTIFKRAGRYLSVGLSNVVQLFDPPLIILSGARVQCHYLYAEEVLADMRKITLSNERPPCEIQIHPWDDFVWARGGTAAALSALTDTLVGGQEVARP